MREIKFKAWIPDIERIYQVMNIDVEPQNGKQKYITVWEHPCVESAIIKGKVAKFRLGTGVEIMQYTGLKDKDGVEIYEGDIFTVDEYPFYSDGNLNYVGVVEFVDNSEYLAWYYDLRVVSDRVRGCACGDQLNALANVEIKVLGNKYESPELLDI